MKSASQRFFNRAATVCSLVLVCTAQETGPEIFRPSDRSIVSGPLSVVARGSASAALTLDGNPLKVDRPGPNAITVSLRIAPGKHELALIDTGVEKRVTFFVGDAPPDFAKFRAHPPAATCQTCHAVKDGAWAFKGDTLAENCFTCHKADAFATPHSHNADTLYECQLCHSPHGSTAAKHLKVKKEVACKLCHG